MMLSGVLGFQSVLLLSLLAVCVAIRQKLRNAAAKEEEIVRLVAMASEETAMAEIKYTAEYRSLTVPGQYHCAVCYLPTTTRCSKCKAVRYCSGKCQILHWRQGHKDECYPPTDVIHFGEESGKQAALVMDDDGKVTPHINTSLVHRRNESLHDVSCSSVLESSPSGRSEGFLHDGCMPVSFGISANVNEVHQSKPPSSDSTNLFNGSSYGNTLNKMPSSYSTEEASFRTEFPKDKKLISKDVPLTKLGDRKPIRQAILSMESVTHAPKHRSSTYLPGDRENDLQQLKPDRYLSSSSVSYHNRSSSTPTGRTKPSINSVEVDSRQALPTKIDGIRASSFVAHGDSSSSSTQGQTISSSNSALVDSCQDLPRKDGSTAVLKQTNSLKSSVRKAVQQFKDSKQMKPHQLGLGNEIAKRLNDKVLFPYENFVKLYSSNNVELHPFGLINCGNSCYANAVLQCLSFTRPLTSYLLQGLHSKACRKKGWCFICEFERLLFQAREGKTPLSPIRILSKIEKIGSHLGQGTQEDAHEFLRYAVDTMQSTCLKEAGVAGSVAEETTLIGLTFGGYLQSKIKCRKCLGKSERHEQMMDLTVEIDGEISTLEEALRQFTATELLDGVNKYYCNRCKSYEKAKKKLTIWEAPNILTIVLKRFQSDNFEKLNKSIRYPEVLDMTPYMSGTSDKSPMYSLYAVIVHLDTMNAAFSGHYVCYVKNLHGEWFKIDDSSVMPVESDRVLMQGAYMLLYARHSPRPRSSYSANNNVVPRDIKPKKRNFEAIPTNRPIPRVSSSDYPNRMSLDNPPVDPNNWRYRSVQRIPRVDSSSDNSSLFSCSDASSCATASTKDSGNSEDFSGYLFGEVDPRRYSFPPNTDGSSYRYSSVDVSENAWSSW